MERIYCDFNAIKTAFLVFLKGFLHFSSLSLGHRVDQSPPDKLVVTLPVAVVLLRGVVHTGVGGVGGGELLLACSLQ